MAPAAAAPNLGSNPAAADDDRIIHHGRGGAKYAPWRERERERESWGRERENRQFSTILRNETAVESVRFNSGVGDNLTEGGKTNPLIGMDGDEEGKINQSPRQTLIQQGLSNRVRVEENC